MNDLASRSILSILQLENPVRMRIPGVAGYPILTLVLNMFKLIFRENKLLNRTMERAYEFDRNDHKIKKIEASYSSS